MACLLGPVTTQRPNEGDCGGVKTLKNGARVSQIAETEPGPQIHPLISTSGISMPL